MKIDMLSNKKVASSISKNKSVKANAKLNYN